jgi:3-oxoacyl-[acyl-carrier protein] reductase
VGVNYRSDRGRADAVVEAIERDGGRATAVAGDVSDPDTPDQLFGQVEQAFGVPVLVLVNNAGVNRDDLAPSLSDEEWSLVLDTNLSAAFRLTRRALRGMLRARTGRIVNISSVAGLRANPGQANYAAAKAGLMAFTKTVAVEVARRGITVNAVAPGLIETDMTTDVPKEVLAAVPARRIGTPEEVAACVRFLASAQASYVTGAVLTVDGGLAA